MKARTITSVEFANGYLQLAALWRTSKRKFHKALKVLLAKSSLHLHFALLLGFCGRLGKMRFAKRLITEAWDLATEVRLIAVELRKPVCARWDWVRENADKYRRILYESAPNSLVGLRIERLLAAAGCPVVPF